MVSKLKNILLAGGTYLWAKFLFIPLVLIGMFFEKEIPLLQKTLNWIFEYGLLLLLGLLVLIILIKKETSFLNKAKNNIPNFQTYLIYVGWLPFVALILDYFWGNMEYLGDFYITAFFTSVVVAKLKNENKRTMMIALGILSFIPIGIIVLMLHGDPCSDDGTCKEGTILKNADGSNFIVNQENCQKEHFWDNKNKTCHFNK